MHEGPPALRPLGVLDDDAPRETGTPADAGGCDGGSCPAPWLAGVSLAGAEFGANVPGTYGADSTFPTELGRLTSLVSYAVGKGAHVVLEPHNDARYGGQVVGSAAVPDAALADPWSRLAALEWTGAHGWSDTWYGSSNATVMLGVVDPGANDAYEVHPYLEADSSGTSTACVSTTIGAERLAGFTAWLKTNGRRGFLGEIGGGRNATCYAALGDALSHLDANRDAWIGFTYRAAGPWWGSYEFSLEPTSGVDAPQLASIVPHL